MHFIISEAIQPTLFLGVKSRKEEENLEEIFCIKISEYFFAKATNLRKFENTYVEMQNAFKINCSTIFEPFSRDFKKVSKK